MNKRLTVVCFFVFGFALFVSPAQAQRRGSGGGARRGSFAFSRHGHRFSGNRGFGDDWFPYDFYDDYGPYYEPYGYGPEPSQAPPSAAAQPVEPLSSAPERKPPESLVLELRGDRWVRITNHGASLSAEEPGQPERDGTSEPPSAGARLVPRRTEAPEPSSESARTTLVFRDGHKEEIQKYVIVDQTIYAGAEHWRSGSWKREISIAELDVPATLALNRERGTKFSLPSGPNEVVVRP